MSEYDEDELDGWIEQLDDSEDSNDEVQSRRRPRDPFTSLNNDAESGLRQRLFLDGEADFDDDNAIESDGELSEMDSRLDFEVRMVTPSRGRRRRILDRADFNELERASRH